MLRGFYTGLLSTAVLCGVSLLPAGKALAQDVPGSADPGRAGRNLQERIAPPRAAPDIQVKGMGLARPPANADTISLTLTEIRFEGVTIYKESDLRALYQKSLGQEISLADIYAIAAELTAKYRNDGYILTQVVVPPQTIEDGIVNLRVVEGRIDDIRVTGDSSEKESELSLVRRYASHIKDSGRPLNVRDLERALLLINDLPGVHARSVVSPSRTRTGAADLVITVERDPYDAFLGVDNYGSRYLGRWGANAGGDLNSTIFNANERISGQIVYVPHGPLTDHELAYVSGSYWMPVGSMGTSLEAFYSYTDTEPGLDLREFEVEGRSHYLSVTLEHPFIRTRGLSLKGRALLDGRSVENENNIPDTRKDTIRAFRAGGRLDFGDTLLSGGLNSIDAEIAKGLDILGASNSHDASLSRPDGDPQFVKLEVEAYRLQRLTNQVNILLGAKGQLSNAAQLSSEEFGVGGSSFGRGYDPSEIVGDDGIAGKIELQWNPPWQTEWMNGSQVFGFWDGGQVWNDDSTTSKTESLASTGVGVRAHLISDIQTELFVALPLTRQIEAERDDDPRLFLSVSKRF